MKTDPSTENATGSLLPGDGGCENDEVAVGRIVDPEERIIELQGKQIQLTPELFHADSEEE